MDLDGVYIEADSHEVHYRANADNCAISPASGLVIIELSNDNLLIGSKGRVETIEVVGFRESLAIRIWRARKPAN